MIRFSFTRFVLSPCLVTVHGSLLYLFAKRFDGQKCVKHTKYNLTPKAIIKNHLNFHVWLIFLVMVILNHRHRAVSLHIPRFIRSMHNRMKMHVWFFFDHFNIFHTIHSQRRRHHCRLMSSSVFSNCLTVKIFTIIQGHGQLLLYKMYIPFAHTVQVHIHKNKQCPLSLLQMLFN